MKVGWQSKSFDDCIEKVTYTTKIQRKDFLEVGTYPVISQEEAFINGYWDSEDDLFRVENPLVVFGDHTKVLKYVDFDFVLGADGVKLLPPKEFLVPKFFYYQLQTAQLDSLGYARHYKLLKELEIKYPDRAEQHRIVAILDAAFDSIATAKDNAEQNLQNARALFDSHLQQVFTERGEGWVETAKPLEDLCELIVDCEHKTAPTQQDGFPSIRTTNIGKGKLLLDGVNRVSQETYGAWTRRAVPKEGDLIFAREAPAGNVAAIPPNLNVCLGQRTVLIRPKKTVFDSGFLVYLLQSPKMQQKLLAHSKGATVKHINMKDIRALNVGPIPPLSVQQSVARLIERMLEEAEHLESLYRQKLAALDELKKSLLHQAFSGAL